MANKMKVYFDKLPFTLDRYERNGENGKINCQHELCIMT